MYGIIPAAGLALHIPASVASFSCGHVLVSWMGVTVAINGLNADGYINIIQSEDILAQLSMVINKASGCPTHSSELCDTVLC